MASNPINEPDPQPEQPQPGYYICETTLAAHRPQVPSFTVLNHQLTSLNTDELQCVIVMLSSHCDRLASEVNSFQRHNPNASPNP